MQVVKEEKFEFITGNLVKFYCIKIFAPITEM